MPNYQVWYKKNFIQDTEEAIETFEDSYVPVMLLWEETLDDVYFMMQGFNWSPNGEARQAIRELKLDHTSMSVGDVIENRDLDRWWLVVDIGFEDITDKMKERV